MASKRANIADGSGISLEKIEAKSLQARVYERLKSALISGKFEPGQVLVIRDLAEQLGTSPMPIRQSLHRLVSEYALEEENRVRSSVRVPEISQKAFEDLRSVRRLVEGEAAARAALNARPSLIGQLRALDEEIGIAVKNGDEEGVILANRHFHFALYEAAGSKALLRVIESLWLQSGPYFRALISRYFSDESDKSEADVNSHEAMLSAIEAGDAEAAREALHADIEAAATYFTQIQDTL